MPSGHEYPIAPPPPTTPTPEIQKHAWLNKHPYLTSGIAVLSLILFSLLIVSAKSGVSGSRDGTNWVGAGGVFFTGGRNMRQTDRISAEQIIKDTSPETQLGYIPITPPSADGFETDGSGDLSALLTQLAQPNTQEGGTPDTQNQSAFSFIPQGLISVNTSTKKLSPEQEALHNYGNEAGNAIQAFEGLHLNASQLLKDHAEDRQNPDKAKVIDRFGYDLALLGRELASLENIPPIMKSAHDAYATSYRQVGTNLTKVAAASTDEEFLAAIGEYNKSVEALSKRFLAIVTLFAAYEVTFSSSDTGSVFVFNQSPSF